METLRPILNLNKNLFETENHLVIYIYAVNMFQTIKALEHNNGNLIVKDEVEVLELTEYEKMVSAFYSRLLQQRRHTRLARERNQRWRLQKTIKRYPGWNERTVDNLQRLFRIYDRDEHGTIDINNFCSVLDNLGDKSSPVYRKQQFDNLNDPDGMINIDQYLELVYNFHSKNEEGEITGLAKLCYEFSEHVQSMSSLTVGEQLEYGLF